MYLPLRVSGSVRGERREMWLLARICAWHAEGHRLTPQYLHLKGSQEEGVWEDPSVIEKSLIVFLSCET